MIDANINYTTEDGDYIKGAEIPRDGFRPSRHDTGVGGC